MGTNCELVPYGIQNERSTVRGHVCPGVKRVYVFPSDAGNEAIASNRYRKTTAGQPGVDGPTAEGFLVPPMDIRCCASIELRPLAWERIYFDDREDTSTKGAKAVWLVERMVYAGLFPLPLPLGGVDCDPSKEVQIEGDDIIVRITNSEVRIQVKCDFWGGEAALGGTGNLFLQVAERNPLHRT